MGVFVMIYHVHTYITEKIWVIRVHLKTHKSFISFAFQENPNVATNVSMAARPLGSKLCETQGLSLLRFSETEVFLVPSG